MKYRWTVYQEGSPWVLPWQEGVSTILVEGTCVAYFTSADGKTFTIHFGRNTLSHLLLEDP